MHLKKWIRRKLVKKVPVSIPALYGNLLQGKTALITGGSSGIGLAIATAFIKNGASKVIIAGRNKDKLDKACDCLGDKSVGLVMDVKDTNQAKNIFDQTVKTLGETTIDILVNSAGVNTGAPFPQTKQEDYDSVMDTDLRGTYFLSQLFANYLVAQKKKGHILNVASVSAYRPANSAYMLSKWGVRGLTEGMAKSLIKDGIVVNAIAPGPTLTPMYRKDDDEKFLDLPASPAGRMATPEEIANLSVILCSSLGDLIVGETLVVSGGAGNLTFDDIAY